MEELIQKQKDLNERLGERDFNKILCVKQTQSCFTLFKKKKRHILVMWHFPTPRTEKLTSYQAPAPYTNVDETSFVPYLW